VHELKQGLAAFFASIAWLFCAAAAQADPAGTRVGESVIVERVDDISVSEFWRLGHEKTFYTRQGNAPGGSLGLWIFDYEQAPRDGGWVAVGLIGVGFGDLGEVPVMVKVWARSSGEIMGPKIAVEEQRAKPDQSSAFDISFRGQHFLLTTTPAGLVYLDGKQIGRIE
jgi:hypothetical protein